MMFLEKRIFRVVALLCALVIGASAQANEIEDDILLFAPAATSTYIPYDLSQVAVYLGDLLGETAGYETADVVFEASTGRSLLESYVHPDIKPVTLASVTAGYRQVILLDNFTFNRDFPEMAFEGTYQMSKAILRSGSTPHLLMGASPSASERAAIQENAYRVANGCGIHLIPAGAGAMEALDTLSIPSLDDDRTSYLVACMIYSQITGQTAASSTYAPTSGGNPIAEAAALASLADSTHATEFAQTQYNTDVGNEGVIRYRPLDISSAPFNNKVRYIYKGTSTENGTSTRLNEIINHTYSAAKNSLGRRDGGWQMLYLSDLERNQATLEGVENQGVFIYARATDVTAATVRSFSQANVLPILYDRPYEYDDSLGVQGPENLLRNFHKDLDYYFGEYYNLGWNLVGFHAALGRFYELEPTLIATTDKVHMSDPMYYMLASQMLTSALGTELPPPSGLSGQALVGYQVGQEFIKQAAHLSEDGAFTPDSRLNVIEPTPHLTEPGVFYSLQLQAEAGSGGYSWEVDPSAALPDGLTLSSTGLISGIATTYFNSQVVVVKVTDTAGAFRKAHLTLFTPPNPVPVPGADTATALSGQPVSIDVLANDFDADGQPSPLSIVSVASPNWGSAEIVAGEIVYTPEGNLSSRDSFSYTITDGEHLVTGSIEVLHNSGYVWIPLDEDTGSSAADAHGSTVGSLLNFGDVEAAHVDGRYGKALSFDGNNDRVDLNTLQDLPLGSSPRTVMCWIRTPADVPEQGQAFFGYGIRENGRGFNFKLLHDGVVATQQLALDIKGSTIRGDTDLADNQWHHVAVVCEDLNDDGKVVMGECRLYVDGKAENATVLNSQTLGINTGAGNSPVIGDSSYLNNFNFRGEIDEVRVFPVALTADEVAAYAGGTADAAARWHLDQFGDASVLWTADDDGDELNRLFEYALGGDPSVAEAPDFGYEFAFNSDTEKLEVSFNRRQGDTHGLSYIAEASSDLIDWETLTTSQITTEPHPSLPGYDRVTFEADDETQPKQFLRLRIEAQ